MSLIDDLFRKSSLLEELSMNSQYEKLNPAQEQIAWAEGDTVSTTKRGITFNNAYKSMEVVRRGTDLLVDACAGVNYDVKGKLPFTGQTLSVKARRIFELLNYRPNPFEDINSFRRNIFMDVILEGNAFLYFDGAYLFLLPACRVEILTDPKVYIKGYKYDGTTFFKPTEVIHIKDNSADSVYRGDSRLRSASQSIAILDSMLGYQENFFDNGAVPGLVLKTKDILSQRIKDRMVSMWSQKYNPKSGGRRPVVLDGGLELDSVNPGNFKELDFSKSIEDSEGRILKALGVPPILLNSGNNANIAPNMKLFYNTTVLSLIQKYVAALEAYFAYDIKQDVSEVTALRPELKDEAAYYTGLVNNGIMTAAEARVALRLEDLGDESLNEIRIPANVAGSASGVAGQEGGKPPKEEDE